MRHRHRLFLEQIKNRMVDSSLRYDDCGRYHSNDLGCKGMSLFNGYNGLNDVLARGEAALVVSLTSITGSVFGTIAVLGVIIYQSLAGIRLSEALE